MVLPQGEQVQKRARCLASRVLLLVFGTLAACHHATAPALNLATLSIARDAARFTISAATDSSVTFRAAEVRWLRFGMRGYVVDPMQRDALIARVTVQHIDSVSVIATIAGGVSPVALSHVVLFERPAIAWWRDKRFWLGAGAGAVTGIIATSAAK